MRPFPSMEGVVDYALHPSRSDWMDVFLCADARFFLGNSSGLFVVATVFGTPCALANMIPSSHLAYAPSDVAILKLLWSTRDGRYLTFGEIFSQPVAGYRFANRFLEDGLRVDENSEEELRDLVLEMLERLDGSLVEISKDRARQKRFLSLLRPEHYCYGAASRVSARFLERHQDLLGAEGA
jgi:putative glycosyltransferase (TIGR04372 family)